MPYKHLVDGFDPLMAHLARIAQLGEHPVHTGKVSRFKSWCGYGEYGVPEVHAGLWLQRSGFNSRYSPQGVLSNWLARLPVKQVRKGVGVRVPPPPLVSRKGETMLTYPNPPIEPRPLPMPNPRRDNS